MTEAQLRLFYERVMALRKNTPYILQEWYADGLFRRKRVCTPMVRAADIDAIDKEVGSE